MRVKRFVAQIVAATGVTLCSLVAVATPASAATITTAACEAGGGTVIDHGAWVGCHGAGFGPSGTKILD